MKITHVRNATLLLEVGGRRILIDPMLGAKGSLAPFPTVADNDSRNPLVDLAVPLADLLSVDAVVVTHTHADHWDAAAASLLPRGVPVLTQNAADALCISDAGFSDVRVLDQPIDLWGTILTRTDGQHGSDAALEAWPTLGEASGVVVRHPGEPVLYVAGDTVWNEHVRAALDTHLPDIVVLNTGEARLSDGSRIITGAHDILHVHRSAPRAQIVAVHMEALNHCVATRQQVHELALEHGITDRVHVPEDAAVLTF